MEDVEDRSMQAGCVVPGPRARNNAAATVAGSTPDTEGCLVGQQQWEEIHARRAGGATVSAIARELDLDRKTVRRCLHQQAWRPYRRNLAAPTLLDEHRQWLAERAPQVNYSARILHQELRGEYGWAGSYETVKLAVRPLREAAC